MSSIVAVDIGGTQIRAALYVENSLNPINYKKIATKHHNKSAFEQLLSAIKSVWDKRTVKAISVAAPGPLDPKTGVIFSTPNIPGWVDFPLGQKLTEQFGVPTYIGNDANLAALGEWRFGAGQGYHDLLYLTISTGIGGGIISGDRLILGTQGLAAELGHISVLPNGPLCSCGVPGHLEAVASGPAIVYYVKERLTEGYPSSLNLKVEMDCINVAQAARQGDSLAQQGFTRAGKFLGQALADFLHMFNSEIVIIGGGVSQSSDLFWEPMQMSLRNNIMNKFFLSNLVVTTAKLGDDAGLLGARVQVEMT